MPQLDTKQRATIAFLNAEGKSARFIAQKLNCSTSTVSRWSKRACCIERKRRQVHKVLLSPNAAERAEELLRANHSGGASAVASKLYEEGLVASVPSRNTVIRAAKKVAAASGQPLKYSRGLPKKGLTQATKDKRISFCEENQSTQWDMVMFTDRKKFAFKYPGTKVFAGRWFNSSGEGDEGAFRPNHPQVYNVYGGITASTRTL